MAAPRQDDKAMAMHDLYLAGHSLAKVAEAFGVTRQSVYKMLSQRGLPLRWRDEPLPFVIFDGRRYTLRKVGYYGCTTSRRGYLHRHVWEKANGPIPPGHDIHHRDGNRSNNSVGNLECIPKAEHTRRHGHRGNQHTKRRRAT